MTFALIEGRPVHIYAPVPSQVRRLVDDCPTCKRRTRKVALYTKWLGWETICCACGERWQDGERCPRPFERGWRQRSSARARAVWQTGRPS